MSVINHPRDVLKSEADKPALIMAKSGEVVTFASLVANANRAARLFRSIGLQAGDCIAICMENDPRYFELCWAAHNAGLYYTPISSRLKSSEVAYIVTDCAARALFASAAMREVVVDALALSGNRCAGYMTGGDAPGFVAYEQALARMPDLSIDESVQGTAMMYSSGTTGAPKGIRPPLSQLRVDELAPLPLRLRELYGFDANTVYLSPAPLYHAAPLKFCLTVLAGGGTVVVMEKFDAELALQCIEKYRVTHSQWVPTMFSRLLKLPDGIRRRFDLSSHRLAIHSAAPCPIDLKERMLQWWGPIIHEYYSGSESIGMCAIGPEEWQRHKGSVGKAVRGVPHVVDECGQELPPGETGLIYFETATTLRYHNDPQKTAKAHNDRGWATMGDVGYIDAEGYLYLTDRRDFVIISGGVNIYPQEGEAVLAGHPRVADVAMFGVPNEDFGEEVKAVIVPQPIGDAGPNLERELIEFCRARLSSIKCPKSIDFVNELPREPTGKLLKKQLRQHYWDQAKTLKAMK
jgi:acyl-CoA synthetase (AMP-forming)/AMP-acid ligase II